MVRSFNFTRIPNIVFGSGSRKRIPGIVKGFGNNIILVTGKKSFLSGTRGHKILNELKNNGIRFEIVGISNEPTPEDVDNAVNMLKGSNIECVLSIGGGSVIDAGKAISAMATVEGSVKDYLEGVGELNHPGTKIPFIAMPTTSGTGSEATKNAVISMIGENGFKKSLRHDNFVPEYAIIDPELTINCPPEISAPAGMDAFTQLVESFLSVKSSIMTDALALNGIEKLVNSIEITVRNGSDIKARENMAYAALLSGITLANAGLGVIHGFAQPLGSLFPIPHGIVCGTLMAPANEISLNKVLEEENTRILNKYARLGSFINCNLIKEHELASAFIQYLNELTEKLRIPKLSRYNINESHFDRVIQSTDLKNHPINLNHGDLRQILTLRV